MKTAYNFFLRHQKIFFLVLTIFAALWILWPLHNFQPALAQDDHGRDLYAFWQTSQGATPYQDYWWCYGPLMPYYYSGIFKALGTTIQSALIGNILIGIICAMLFYLSLSCFIPYFWAFIGASWFTLFNPSFPHTYNHIGAIAGLLWITLNLFSYLKTSKKIFLWLGFLSVALTALIKLNMGICGLITFVACAALLDASRHTLKQNIRIYIYGTLLSGASLLLIHIFFVQNLPMYYILQCFPFLKNYRQSLPEIHLTILQRALWFLKATFSQIRSFRLIIAAITITLFTVFTLKALKKKEIGTDNKNIFWALFFTTVLLVMASHEFLLSDMSYCTHWMKPFQLLIIFLAIGAGILKIPRIIQGLLALFFGFSILLAANAYHQEIQASKNPVQYFSINKDAAYLTNSPAWISIVRQTTSFLTTSLERNESFLALPYQPLFYFLTKKQSPARELCFFDFMNITLEQERKIILQLETKKNNYIVLSSRCNSAEPGLGLFGKTYCPALAKYIDENFFVIKTFGEWNSDPTETLAFGIKILKRK